MRLNLIFFQVFSISNFFLNIFIVFTFLFFGYHDIAAQGFISISICNLFTYGFSGNIRNIYLGSKNTVSIKEIVLFRLVISLVALFVSSFVVYFFISKLNFYYLLGIIILTVTSFVFELLIARTEKTNTINKYHAFNVLIFFISIFFLISFDLLQIFLIFVLLHVLLNFIFFRKIFKNITKEKVKFILNFKKNLDLGIYSTFIKTFSNLIWRYSAFLLLGNSKSAILFMAFSLGSFFGTLFDISYGASFLKQIKKSINLFLNTIFFIYFLLVSILVIVFKKFSYLTVSEFEYFYLATYISLCGSYVIMYALQYRQKLFEVKALQNICFKYDINIYFFNALIIPLLYFINIDFVVMAYLISSIYFYITYKIFVKNKYEKKYTN